MSSMEMSTLDSHLTLVCGIELSPFTVEEKYKQFTTSFLSKIDLLMHWMESRLGYWSSLLNQTNDCYTKLDSILSQQTYNGINFEYPLLSLEGLLRRIP